MKKILLSVCALAVLAGFGLAYAVAQNGAAAAATNAAVLPHKVGLIDMAYLFSKYDKFTVLREELKQEIEGADSGLKGQLERIKAIQAEMKSLVPNSPDYISREKQVTEMAAKIEADRRTMQREFMRKESKIYQQVYGEVTEAVEKYAEIYKFTLILRYSREEAIQDDPQKIMQALQRQVVFNRNDDDVTESVLRYLNKNFAANAGKRPAAAPANTAKKPGATTPR